MVVDTRLARLLHVLLHMHLHGGGTTSETISKMLHTNPVVVRRTMAVMRDAGYVTSTGGRGGGWSLSANLSTLTVADVYNALAPSSIFTLGPAVDNPSCPVEAAVNRHLTEALTRAENTLLHHFGQTRLTDLALEISP
ncbi:MAG: Rrf2 family transcriptional regulator [Alcaligenaceae bacterium]|uniref:Rrf2 family transcriptional regulator n=1 Tax=Acidovorax sp. LjRoot117 TaxID=3342255 RepID=UPI0010E7A45B|nr:MAG: Rrf2 family transcriptional regulator [Alcaligenaceae bacterium]